MKSKTHFCCQGDPQFHRGLIPVWARELWAVQHEGGDGVFFSLVVQQQQRQQQEDKMAAYSECLEAAEGEHYNPDMSLRSLNSRWL